MATEELLLPWLNSLIVVPSALLVSGLEDLKDGHVLTEITRELQIQWRTLSPHAPSEFITNLSKAYQWLVDTYGTASFPPELCGPDALSQLRRGDAAAVWALVGYLKARLDEVEMLAPHHSMSHSQGRSSSAAYAGAASSSGSGGDRGGAGAAGLRSLQSLFLHSGGAGAGAGAGAAATPTSPGDGTGDGEPEGPFETHANDGDWGVSSTSSSGSGSGSGGGGSPYGAAGTPGPSGAFAYAWRGAAAASATPDAVSPSLGYYSGGYSSAPSAAAASSSSGPFEYSSSLRDEWFSAAPSAISTFHPPQQHDAQPPLPLPLPPQPKQQQSGSRRAAAPSQELQQPLQNLQSTANLSAAADAAVARFSQSATTGTTAAATTTTAAAVLPPPTVAVAVTSATNTVPPVIQPYPTTNNSSAAAAPAPAAPQQQPQQPIRRFSSAAELRAAAEAALVAAGRHTATPAPTPAASATQPLLQSPDRSLRGAAATGTGAGANGSGGHRSLSPDAAPGAEAAAASTAGGKVHWNASTYLPPQPKHAPSGMYVKHVPLIQLSPSKGRGRAAMAQSRNGSSSGGGAADAATAAASSSSSSAEAASASASAAVVRSGIRVGSLLDPGYVPRLAIPLPIPAAAVAAAAAAASRVADSDAPVPAAPVAEPAAVPVPAAAPAPAPVPAPPPPRHPALPSVVDSDGFAPPYSAAASRAGSIVGPSSSSYSAAAASAAAAAPYPGGSGRSTACSHAGSVAESVATATHSLADEEYVLCTKQQRTVIRWLKGLGVDLTLEGRTAYTTARPDPSYDLSMGSGRFDPSVLPRLLADGVLLCEIVALAETRSGSRIPTMRIRNPTATSAGGGFSSGMSVTSRTAGSVMTAGTSSGGAGGAAGVLEVLPGTVLPREGQIADSARHKNLELALELLRSRPKVPPRYLWSTAELAGGHAYEAAWGLLEDVHKAYGAATRVVTPSRLRKQQQQQPAAAPAPAPAVAATEEGSADRLAQAQLLPSSALSAGVVAAARSTSPPPLPPQAPTTFSSPQRTRAAAPPPAIMLSPSASVKTAGTAGGYGSGASGQLLHLGDLSSSSSSAAAVAAAAAAAVNNAAGLDVVDGHLVQYVLPATEHRAAALGGSASTASASASSSAAAGGAGGGEGPMVLDSRRYRLQPAEPERIPGITAGSRLRAGPPADYAADGGAKKPPTASHYGLPAGAGGSKVIKHLPLLHTAVPVPPQIAALLPSRAAVNTSTTSGGNVSNLSAGGGSGSKAGKSHKAAAFPRVTQEQVASVQRWITFGGFAELLPGAAVQEQHVLDTTLFNGVLLVHLARALEPDTAPLAGPHPLRHYPRPKSFGEARANIEAALTVLRASHTTNPPPAADAAPAAASASGGGDYYHGKAQLQVEEEEGRRGSLTGGFGFGSSRFDGSYSITGNGSGDIMPTITIAGPPVPAASKHQQQQQQQQASVSYGAGYGLEPQPQRRLPLAYLWCTEELLLGNEDAAWGLLWWLCDCYTGGRATTSAAVAAAHEAERSAATAASMAAQARQHALTDPVPGAVPLLNQHGDVVAYYRSEAEASAAVAALQQAAAAEVAAATAAAAFTSMQAAAVAHTMVEGGEANLYEAETIGWLCSCGVLKRLGLMGDDHGSDRGEGVAGEVDVGPTCLHDLLGPMCDGSLLGAVAAHVCRVTGTEPLHGISYHPRTEAVARANITKALTALRRVLHMSLRYITLPNIEASIYEGQHTECLGVLHDAHRAAEGLPPLTRVWKPLTPANGGGGGGGAGAGGGQRMLLPPDPEFTPQVIVLAPPTIPAPPPEPSPADVAAEEEAAAARAERAARARTAFRSHGHGHSGINASAEGTTTSPPASPAPASRMSRLPSPSRWQQRREQEAAEAAAEAEVPMPPPSLSAPAPEAEAAQPLDAETAGLVTWLAGLGVRLHAPHHLLPTSPAAPEFADGILLCVLVEELEGSRGRKDTVRGIERNPRTGGAKLANIRKALEVLRNHPAMPLDHLFSELAIRDGKVAVIRPLLLQLRKAYAARW